MHATPTAQVAFLADHNISAYFQQATTVAFCISNPDDSARWTFHFVRVGAFNAHHAAGAEPQIIKNRPRWRSDTSR